MSRKYIGTISKAVEMETDYIETVVKMKDGELVGIHDNTVDSSANGTDTVGN